MAVLVLAACGGKAGSTGSPEHSGPSKTSLRVDASDGDGDVLHYQWRATAGSIENRDARETVWTMPDGPGLHFAYVLISDAKGGYVEQQYAVASDKLDTAAPVPAPVSRAARGVSDFAGAPIRLRFESGDNTGFAIAGGAPLRRNVYLPDVQVQVSAADSSVVFSGVSDLGGEVSLPKLAASQRYFINCATTQGAVLAPCESGVVPVGFAPGTVATVRTVVPPLAAGRNLRLFGHIALADGAVCGAQNEFFNLQSAATVQLLQADGSALGPVQRVNRYGDYALDAAVALQERPRLRVQCESYTNTLPVPLAVSGFVSSAPVELSHQIPNARPRVVKMVANGQDGNVRGDMVELETTGALSKGQPAPDHFLSYKGKDSRLSACMYYRALGAAADCDAQGTMVAPIAFDDWKRRHKFKPYGGGNTEVAANFVNKWDLNLVRRMVATRSAPDAVAFYVCNHPGPDGSSQLETDFVIDLGLSDEKRVACVAMEWSTSPGVNDGLPFTKFLTFAPSGALLQSINLDGRGEKYMPGACVACHGGTQYNGRFPDKGDPSPLLGSRFLPFDTANYLFSSRPTLTEAAQMESLFSLNQLVRATEQTSAAAPDSATTRLIDGWYLGGKMLDKSFLPPNWRVDESQAASAGAAKFYREVLGASCRTCHTALGSRFDWDALGPAALKGRAEAHVCGGTADIAVNASMPNALVTLNSLSERGKADPALAALMRSFLGCATPLPDPAYPKR